MDFAKLALTVLGFGHLLRVVKLENFEQSEWVIKYKKALIVLTRFTTFTGWFIVAYGRLLLYLSFVPFRDYVPLLFAIAVIEFLASLHILRKIYKARRKMCIGIDIAMTVGIVSLVIAIIKNADMIVVI